MWEKSKLEVEIANFARINVQKLWTGGEAKLRALSLLWFELEILKSRKNPKREPRICYINIIFSDNRNYKVAAYCSHVNCLAQKPLLLYN